MAIVVCKILFVLQLLYCVVLSSHDGIAYSIPCCPPLCSHSHLISLPLNQGDWTRRVDYSARVSLKCKRGSASNTASKLISPPFGSIDSTMLRVSHTCCDESRDTLRQLALIYLSQYFGFGSATNKNNWALRSQYQTSKNCLFACSSHDSDTHSILCSANHHHQSYLQHKPFLVPNPHVSNSVCYTLGYGNPRFVSLFSVFFFCFSSITSNDLLLRCCCSCFWIVG